MAKIIKFVYDIILFFFIFILATEGLNLPMVCDIDADCPKSEDYYYELMCILHKCIFVFKLDPEPGLGRIIHYLI
ncbi:unnamed protein product [Trifolium pratense]|uniref:Uncharacterized protein n=1 Tax=Trifolium pratense TaxID=57577 RepID=A0ACB0K696_TRIPR|nr:unnamed protein product [Trifolium pratense]